MNSDFIRADWPAPDNIVAGTTLRNANVTALEFLGEPCWLNQIHGADVVMARHFDTPPDADASVSARAGAVCVVRTADCLPVLFCSADEARIAAAHAGWRGLAAGVIEATLEKMACSAADLLVWLGPAISQPAYEIGDEVRDSLLAEDPGATSCFVGNERGRWQADLYELARRRLRAQGVTGIYGGGLCTFADAERFYSYRRDADTGRMVSFVALQALENEGRGAI